MDCIKLLKNIVKDNEYFGALFNKYCDEYSIENRDLLLANCLVESASFSRKKESMHYTTASRLEAIFPSVFKGTNNKASDYLNSTEKASKLIYGTGQKAKNLGNKSEKDGFDFLGRGFIQLTGRYLYEEFKKDTGFDVVSIPSLLEQDEFACMSACWYWNKFGLKKCKTVAETRKIINSGQGVTEVNNVYLKIIKNK